MNLFLKLKVSNIFRRNEGSGCSSGHVEILLNHDHHLRRCHHHWASSLHWWMHSLHCTGLLESSVSHFNLTKKITRVRSLIRIHCHVWLRCCHHLGLHHYRRTINHW